MLDFSFDGFNNFLNSKPNQDPLVGEYVRSKLRPKKFAEKITVDDDNDIPILVREFCRDGGTIIESHRDGDVTICVNFGSFRVHKFFVKPSD
jgi:hypothetical protein